MQRCSLELSQVDELGGGLENLGILSDQNVPANLELIWTETVDGIQSMDDNDDEPGFSGGYLHIYRTTRPLYINRMPAGKTTMGTLDTQDYILRIITDGDNLKGV
ncbi:hypothetical protein BJ875DRAFT_464621 [Amylocarpus encephaloides]|uniref:Uncharacterized protein n=1 Tax=Amylocarpus encephaloides TaxID=45428 RepID=A0A9P7YG49_9HELO|nr:hypothetical protein BJ875DRAFT_464621 [Amylocarpus encephaloides]